MIPTVERRIEIDSGEPVRELAGRLVRTGPAVILDGPAWSGGTLLGLAPRIVEQSHGSDEALRRLSSLVATRRREGGSGSTGVVAVVGYELFAPRGPDGVPAWTVFAIDRSLADDGSGPAVVARGAAAAETLDAVRRELDASRLRGGPDPAPARATAAPRTSLPREAYLRAAARLLEHIACGDVYQANLCQRLTVPYEGDELALHERIGRNRTAPHAAFVRGTGFSLVSASPETFLRISADRTVETFPIKGTRPRSDDPDLDRAAADELLRSAKDRAELLMIVDLERNDLARVSEPGSVVVPEGCALRSYATVHHLVATVRGRLRAEVDAAEIVRATFPGGSITGAPKRRAMELLRGIEPVRRGLFTGSLFWFGDDGRTDSSILIRSVVLDGRSASIGAGGGIVADSEPEAEWRESNHKARALCRALSFEPEEAS